MNASNHSMTDTTEFDPCGSGGNTLVELIGGGLLATTSGLGIALSMVMQRYALTFAVGAKVPLFFCELPRPTVWSIGMFSYQLSQTLFQLAMVFAPLSLCTTVFTLLLVWNVFFSRRILGERPSKSRVTGAYVIGVGATISVFGVPTDVCNIFLLDDIFDLFFRRLPGMCFVYSLLSLMFLLAAVVWCFDKTYSIRNPPPPLELPPKKQPTQPPKKKPPPPVWLDDVMVLLAPVAVALQEAIGAIVAKSLTNIVWNQIRPGGKPSEQPATSVLWWSLWLACICLIVLSMVYIKLVYARYEATTALPVEYGTLHFCQILSGMLFFEEYKAMDSTQFLLTFVGLSVVLFGVALSSELHKRYFGQERELQWPDDPAKEAYTEEGQAGTPTELSSSTTRSDAHLVNQVL